MKATRPLFAALTAALLFATALTIAPPAPPAARPPLSNQHAPLDTATTTPTPAGCDGWSVAAPYPIPVAGNAVVSLGGYIYSFGGSITSTNVTNAAYKFDGNTWTAIASLPVSRTFASAVTDGTYIYIINGTGQYSSSGSETNTLYRYDPIANTYTQLASDNYATTNQAAVYLVGRIYRIGGNVHMSVSQDTPTSSVDVYIVATNSWATATDYPFPLSDEMAIAYGQYIYVAGGILIGASPTKTYRYDPGSHLWEDAPIADLPVGVTYSPSGLLNGGWLVAGGQTNLIWNPTTNTWNINASLSQTVSYAGGAVLDGAFYMVGGRDGQQTYTSTWRYTNSCPPSPTPTGTPSTPTSSPTPPCQVWQEQPAYPLAMNGSAVVSLNGYLYSFGGLIDYAEVVNAYKYDGNTWTRIADLPGPRSDARAVTDGTYIYILNGDIPVQGLVSKALYRYDPASDSYTELAAPAVATDMQAAAYLNGRIYRVGGNTGQDNTLTNSVEVYNIATNNWSRVANYPTTIGLAMAGALNGYIYMAGGATGSGSYITKTYRYDPNTDTWSDAAIADLPSPRGLAASGIFGGKWLLAGGLTTPSNSAIVWDPVTNTWSNIASMVQPRLYLTGATLGSAFYAIGGFHGQPPDDISNDNQRYTNTCPTPTPTPTLCPVPFGDISGDLFYGAIGALYCRGAISGTDATHYSPAGTSTRGQFAKVVVLGFGASFYTPATPDFNDVHPGYFAYLYIESGFHDGILSGYDSAGCTAHGITPPCYLPNIAITRGQLTKLVVNAGGYTLYTPTGGAQDFTDVPTSNVFYISIETAAHNSVINGYPDHTFRPNNNIRRDEMAQIVYEGIVHKPLASAEC